MPEVTSENEKRYHTYHAEAHVLSGKLELPLNQEIHPQALAKLSNEGGYLAQQARDYRLESVISYSGASTQVTGNLEVKEGHGWNTLATCVVEELNILDVITADRVVAQASIEYPLIGYVPKITFLGTKFENLRIAGHPVKLDLCLDIFGDKPENDAAYTKDAGFVKRVSDQHARLRGRKSLIAELLEGYNRTPESFGNPNEKGESVECSLVNQAEGGYPGETCGHVIKVPDFGVIHLAQVRLEHKDYCPTTGVPRETYVHLNMIHAKMGCIATGNASVSKFVAGGHTKP